MVVWVYAGGGYSEDKGFVPFLQKHFQNAQFERKTPYRKPLKPRPDMKPDKEYTGDTGKSLAATIQEELRWWDGSAQAVLILDDIDCGDAAERRAMFLKAVENVSATVLIGFAAPELEAWLIADWGGTFDNDKKFKPCSHPLKRALQGKGVPIEMPEDFTCLDENAKYVKLSAILQDEIESVCNVRYSKQNDTPDLLLQINPNNVAAKCPHFREFWRELKRTLAPATT